MIALSKETTAMSAEKKIRYSIARSTAYLETGINNVNVCWIKKRHLSPQQNNNILSKKVFSSSLSKPEPYGRNNLQIHSVFM